MTNCRKICSILETTTLQNEVDISKNISAPLGYLRKFSQYFRKTYQICMCSITYKKNGFISTMSEDNLFVRRHRGLRHHSNSILRPSFLFQLVRICFVRR